MLSDTEVYEIREKLGFAAETGNTRDILRYADQLAGAVRSARAQIEDCIAVALTKPLPEAYKHLTEVAGNLKIELQPYYLAATENESPDHVQSMADIAGPWRRSGSTATIADIEAVRESVREHSVPLAEGLAMGQRMPAADRPTEPAPAPLKPEWADPADYPSARAGEDAPPVPESAEELAADQEAKREHYAGRKPEGGEL